VIKPLNSNITRISLSCMQSAHKTKDSSMIRLYPVLLLAIVCCAWAGDVPDIRLAINPWIADAPANVADTKGFWKAEGLTVEVVNYDTDSEMVNAMKGGKVHLCLTMLGSAFSWAMDKDPVVIVAETDWSNGGDKFIIKKGTDLAKLRGQPVGVYSDDASVAFFVSKCLGKKGLKISDVELLELDAEPLTAQYVAGKLLAVSTYEPQASKVVEAGGEIVATTADFPGCMPEGLVGNKDALAKLPPGALVKFLRGWAKAATWSIDPANAAEYAKIVCTQTYSGPDAPKDAAAVKELMAGVRLHDLAALREQNIKSLPVWLIEVKKFLADNNRLKGELDLGALYDPKAAQAAFAP
jgi:NitT/TauT family transport system substrate-binding protein